TQAPTAVPSPTPAPKPVLSSSQPNVVQGLVLEAGSIWVMGELRNDGTQPAYNATVTARLLTDTGSLAGTANQTFAYLGAGDTVGYRVEVRGATAYSRAEISTDGSTSGVAAFTKMPVTWVKNVKIDVGQSDSRYEFTGSLGNGGDRPVALSAVYVWFLDDQNQVVWMESSFIPATLAPGEASTFTVRTASTRENPRVSDISQLRYYAAGRPQ
ncbi:MAG TPA: FxLYD domain-containing protein, partial [Chloroflexota bacterium]|nr:FxLYD domain-containing protein [Chloroflexota bacterium]